MPVDDRNASDGIPPTVGAMPEPTSPPEPTPLLEPTPPPTTSRLVTTRGAAGILGGAGLTWKAARAVLLSGLAGPGERVGNAVLYEAAEVERLLSRPWVQPRGIERAFVARLAAGRLVLRQGAAAAETGAELEQVRHGWVTDAITRVRLRLAVEEQGYFPFVATVSGFVVLGADIVGVGVRTLELAPPGAWWKRYAGHRLATGRGHHWTFWPESDPRDRLAAPVTESPRARPSRRRTREQGMRADPSSLQQ